MIAAHYDGALQFAVSHKVVQRQSEFVAFAITQPADPRWQPLEFHLLLRQGNPPFKVLVLREHFQHKPVSSRDVGCLSGKGRPAEWPFALAEERPNVGRHKSWEIISVLYACLERERPNIVAIIKCHRAELLQVQHRLHVLTDGSNRPLPVLLRILLA